MFVWLHSCVCPYVVPCVCTYVWAICGGQRTICKIIRSSPFSKSYWLEYFKSSICNPQHTEITDTSMEVQIMWTSLHLWELFLQYNPLVTVKTEVIFLFFSSSQMDQLRSLSRSVQSISVCEYWMPYVLGNRVASQVMGMQPLWGKRSQLLPSAKHSQGNPLSVGQPGWWPPSWATSILDLCMLISSAAYQ